MRFLSTPATLATLAMLMTLVLVLAAPAALAQEAEVGAIEIKDAWTRATPPNAGAGAAFMVLRNTGDTPDRLIAAAGDMADVLEIHKHAMDGGVMRMREVAAGIEIPAGGEIALQPGGYHIMFLGLNRTLAEGEEIALSLTFENAGTVEMTVPVLAFSARHPGAHGGGHGSHAGHGAMTVTPSENPGTLFFNLTTDDAWTNAMAIDFATNARKAGHDVTVFLNVRAVILARPGAEGEIGDVQSALMALRDAGADIYICPACAARAGIEPEEWLDSVETGSPALFDIIMADLTRVISY